MDISFCILAVILLLEPSPVPAARKPLFKKATRYVSRMRRYEKCSDRESALYNTSVSIRPNPDGSVTYGTDYYLTRTAQSLSKLDIRIVRCKEAVSSNSCEYFQSWVWTAGICDLITSKDSIIFKTVQNHHQPPWNCPFQSGAYRSRNITFDVNDFAHLPVKWDGNVWVITFQLFDENSEVFICWLYEMEFLLRRNN